MSPAVNGHPDNFLRDKIRKMEADISAIAHQQNRGVVDSNGVQRIYMGALPSGDIGFEVVDAAGNITEFLPLYAAQLTGTVTATGSTYQDLGFPALTAYVGASGKVKLTLSSQIAAPSNAGVQGGVVSVSIDGATPTGVLAGALVADAGAGSAVNVSASVTLIVSGLSPGSHTFKPAYQAELNPCNFLNTFLQISPF